MKTAIAIMGAMKGGKKGKDKMPMMPPDISEGMMAAAERMMVAVQSKPDTPPSTLEFARGLRQFITMMDEADDAAEGETPPAKSTA